MSAAAPWNDPKITKALFYQSSILERHLKGCRATAMKQGWVVLVTKSFSGLIRYGK